MVSQHKKKRRFARVQLAKQLHVRLSSVPEIFERSDGDIGLGGMFLKTDLQIPVGSDVVITIELSNVHPVELQGQVLRLDTIESSGRRGIAIEFEELPPASEIAMRNLLEKIKSFQS